MNVQLYSDSSTVTFMPEIMACNTGETYVGSSSDGTQHITLVPSASAGNQDTFHASVTDDSTGAIYSIGPNANEEMIVTLRYQEDYGEELDPADEFDPLEREAFRDARKPIPASAQSTSNNASVMEDEAFSIIDVLVLWTAHAECRTSNLARGCNRTETTESNMRSLINLAQAETNVAYVLSGVKAKLNLVHAYYTDYVEASEDSFEIALPHLKVDNDGYMDDVHAKRIEYGADVVALLIDPDQNCGRGYIGPGVNLMFSVTAWDCATGYYSYGHEIGHNFGCEHDKGTKGHCYTTDYNYGYRDPQAEFRSILAYNCVAGQCDNIVGGGCNRVQRFSNPNYLYNGKAMGSAEIDNARHINEVRVEVEGYFNSGTEAPTSPSTTPPTLNPASSPTSSPTSPHADPPTGTPTSTPTPPPTPSAKPTMAPTFRGTPAGTVAKAGKKERRKGGKAAKTAKSSKTKADIQRIREHASNVTYHLPVPPVTNSDQQ